MVINTFVIGLLDFFRGVLFVVVFVLFGLVVFLSERTKCAALL